MRVFVTGATGFVGSAVVQDLIGAGHKVTGLARNEANAKALETAGAEVYYGDLEKPETLKEAVAATDGVIHAGFVHDFSRFVECCEIDRRAIETIGSVLAGSDRPFIVTSGAAIVNPGQWATEDFTLKPGESKHPRKSEQAADEFVSQKVRASIVRLSPSVHGDGDHGFVPMLIDIAKKNGVSAYVGDGQNRWNAVHRLDAAPLYRIALENAGYGTRFHAVAEESISFREIAEMIGKKLNLPVVSKSGQEAADNFGWFLNFASIDCPTSSKYTREKYNWHPKEIGLLEDMENGTYFS